MQQQDFLYFIAKPFLCRQSKPRNGDCHGAAEKEATPEGWQEVTSVSDISNLADHGDEMCKYLHS